MCITISCAPHINLFAGFHMDPVRPNSVARATEQKVFLFRKCSFSKGGRPVCKLMWSFHHQHHQIAETIQRPQNKLPDVSQYSRHTADSCMALQKILIILIIFVYIKQIFIKLKQTTEFISAVNLPERILPLGPVHLQPSPSRTT